jgi:hypothetical protein
MCRYIRARCGAVSKNVQISSEERPNNRDRTWRQEDDNDGISVRGGERKRAHGLRSAKEESTGESKSYDASNSRAIV